jgi:hypothetical protein
MQSELTHKYWRTSAHAMVTASQNIYGMLARKILCKWWGGVSAVVVKGYDSPIDGTATRNLRGLNLTVQNRGG